MSSFPSLYASLPPLRVAGKWNGRLRREALTIKVVPNEAGSEGALLVTLRLAVGREALVQRVREDNLHPRHDDLRKQRKLTTAKKDSPHSCELLRRSEHQGPEVCRCMCVEQNCHFRNGRSGCTLRFTETVRFISGAPAIGALDALDALHGPATRTCMALLIPKAKQAGKQCHESLRGTC